jgi:hypothetical protein
MIWVAWRQQRTEALLAVGIVALLAVLLVPTGIHMAAAYDHLHLARCTGGRDNPGCDAVVSSFFDRFGNIGNLIDWATLLPGMIGVLLAAPFVLQLERRTHWLDWTQSVTRGRWIAGKFGLAIAGAVAGAIALTLLVTWWRGPFVHLQGRMQNSIYDSEGTVVVGYAVFALGLGLAIGALWRNAVPALIVAFGSYFGVRLFVDTWLRQRLVSPLKTTFSAGSGGGGPDLSHAWVLSEYPVDAHGRALSLVSPCAPGASACPGKPGAAQFLHTVYQPASHFWPLQLAETALFGGMAVALIAFAAWWTHRSA